MLRELGGSGRWFKCAAAPVPREAPACTSRAAGSRVFWTLERKESAIFGSEVEAFRCSKRKGVSFTPETVDDMLAAFIDQVDEQEGEDDWEQDIDAWDEAEYNSDDEDGFDPGSRELLVDSRNRIGSTFYEKTLALVWGWCGCVLRCH